MAKKYKEQGYFPYQELELVSSDDTLVMGYLQPIKKMETVLGRKLE